MSTMGEPTTDSGKALAEALFTQCPEFWSGDDANADVATVEKAAAAVERAEIREAIGAMWDREAISDSEEGDIAEGVLDAVFDILDKRDAGIG